MEQTREPLLDEMIAYYRARASEYDEWWERRGRYNRGERWNARWFAEQDEVRQALDDFCPAGRVLELAAGTGIWTRELVRHADEVTAVDASPEVLALNRARIGNGQVRYVEHDLFTWEPDGLYDAVFFGFWLSHVPRRRFAAFWDLVVRSLAPRGRIFFVDSRDYDVADRTSVPAEDLTTRQLNDGREFTIVKRFYGARELESALQPLGIRAAVRTTPSFFVYGSAHPARD